MSQKRTIALCVGHSPSRGSATLGLALVWMRTDAGIPWNPLENSPPWPQASRRVFFYWDNPALCRRREPHHPSVYFLTRHVSIQQTDTTVAPIQLIGVLSVFVKEGDRQTGRDLLASKPVDVTMEGGEASRDAKSGGEKSPAWPCHPLMSHGMLPKAQ